MPSVFTFVYASNSRSNRMSLWEELTIFAAHVSQNKLPWALIGDFNQTLFPSESSIGGTRIPGGMTDFRSFAYTVGLTDLPYQGPHFTWWNSQEASPLAKKLDRVLVNTEWMLSLPLSYSIFGPMEFSDHAPAHIIIGRKDKNKKAFKISNHILTHSKFMDTLSTYWDTTHFAGFSMFILARKLKLLKRVIKSFTFNHFSDLELRVSEARNALTRSQATFAHCPSTANARKQKAYLTKWWFLSSAEEKFLQQRARIKWMQHGDRNSSFFHKVVQGRRALNTIHYLHYNGTRLDAKEDIANACVEYYSGILGTELTALSPHDRERIQTITRFKCDPHMKEILHADITVEEIKAEVFALPLNKCPGPDGYNAEFFKLSWPVVGDDFIRAVKEFFDHGKLLKQFNATAIALIPKSPGADCLAKFRPISLCNVVYKVISKILTRRLQQVLPSIISPLQSAFIKGRHLVENVILASELVKGFGSNSVQPRGALKVDLSKAFDTVRWDFILEILKAADFPPKFVHWIGQCITTTSFSISLNGELCGHFQGKRGLRQGDPLSPSLFIIAMETFSALLHKGFHDGLISHHDLCRNPEITHLSFADDVMVFFDGSIASLQGIKDVFQDFKNLSGLSLNMSKTTLYHSGISASQELLIHSMGFQIGALPVRYLGLPLLARCMRKRDYSPLLDAISRRFSSWTVRSLSFAGRLQLINSVIYSVVNFWMGVFLLPKGCLKAITKMCSKFLWSGDMSKHATPKVSWKNICLPKLEGGLGLRDLSQWNVVMILRLIWWLFTKGSSIWVTWIKRHWLRKHNFWTASTNPITSWIWRSLLSMRPLAKRFITVKLGNGENTSFWFDSWHQGVPLIDRLGDDGPRQVGIHRESSVAKATSSNHWRLPSERSRSLISIQLRSSLLNTPVPNQSQQDDVFLWAESKTFSTKRTWELTRNRSDPKPWTKIIWFNSSPPKQAFLFWVITLDRLPLRSRLARWGLNVIDICCLCSQVSETREHLFLSCEYVKMIWIWMQRKLCCLCNFYSWQGLLNWMQSVTNKEAKFLRIISTQSAIYHIWRERNSRLHNGASTPSRAVITMIDKSVRISLLAALGKKNHSRLLSLWFKYF